MNRHSTESMPLIQPTHGSFTGHETFTLRYAWLKKGIDGLIRRQDIFQSEDAILELGVGKNMVRSIRHWCLATKVLEESDSTPQSRTRNLVPSEFGKALFIDPGYDPYLEDDASLWLLHWHLTTNMSRASTWYWAFNLCKEQDFTRDSLASSLNRVIEERNWNKVSDSSLKADVACFLRTYVPGKRGPASTLEETLDCPLTGLNLISEISNNGHFRFMNGYKAGLPTAVFVYALLDFWNQRFSSQGTLSVRQIIYAEGSPGRVFRLDDDAVLRYLDRIETLTGGSLRFSDTIQQRQVVRSRPIEGKDVLRVYYTD